MPNSLFAQFHPITNTPENINNYFDNLHKETGLPMEHFNNNQNFFDYLGVQPTQKVASASFLELNRENDKDSGFNLWAKKEKKPVDESGNEEEVTPTNLLDKKDKTRAKQARDFFVNKGFTKEQSAGITGNLMAEGGSDLNIKAVGDGGLAKGIGQWHPDRQANFKRVIGKDIDKSSFSDQLEFVTWELNNTHKKALQAIQGSKTPTQAARNFSNLYELPKVYNKDRENYANELYKI